MLLRSKSQGRLLTGAAISHHPKLLTWLLLSVYVFSSLDLPLKFSSRTLCILK